MNHLSLVVPRVLALVAASGITALIVTVHAADIATLGAHDLTARAAPAAAAADTTAARPGTRIALAGSTVR